MRAGTGGRVHVYPNATSAAAAEAAGGAPCVGVACLTQGELRAHLRHAGVVPSLALLFRREHNRQAALLGQAYPSWDDTTLFTAARTRTVAALQSVVSNVRGKDDKSKELVPLCRSADRPSSVPLKALRHPSSFRRPLETMRRRSLAQVVRAY